MNEWTTRGRVETGLVWLGAVLCLAVAGGAFAVLGGAIDYGDGQKESPVHVEQFRVAEPLKDDQAALRDQLEFITAVTEPYDEFERAAADDDEQPEQGGSEHGDLQRQCITVLKEMAFCTGEDSFLDVIGEAPNLRTGGERERFMEGVQDWFEPNGARRYCEALMEQPDIDDHQQIFSESARATTGLCDDFAHTLIDTEIFEILGVFWEDDSESPETVR